MLGPSMEPFQHTLFPSSIVKRSQIGLLFLLEPAHGSREIDGCLGYLAYISVIARISTG